MSVCDKCGQPVPQPNAGRRPYRLTAPEVARIRALIRLGKSDAEIAAEMSVTPMTVNSIRRRKTWAA